MRALEHAYRGQLAREGRSLELVVPLDGGAALIRSRVTDSAPWLSRIVGLEVDDLRMMAKVAAEAADVLEQLEHEAAGPDEGSRCPAILEEPGVRCRRGRGHAGEHRGDAPGCPSGVSLTWQGSNRLRAEAAALRGTR